MARPKKASVAPPALPPPIPVNRGGRPSKYDPKFCEIVIQMGAEGKSKAQFAAYLQVSRPTLDHWIGTRDDFADAMAFAMTLAQAWWEDVGRMGVFNPMFNANLWIWTMKNRFPADYKDKHDIRGNSARPLVTRIQRTIVDPDGSERRVH